MAADRPLELESFLGTAPGMIYRSRLAPEPYVIEFVTDEMTSIAGYPATDFMGREPTRSWLDLVHPDDREEMRSTVRAAPADGAINEVEYRVRRVDGSCAWILSRFRKLTFEDGSVWVHGAVLDVTARHEAEHQRLRLEAERARARSPTTVVVGRAPPADRACAGWQTGWRRSAVRTSSRARPAALPSCAPVRRSAQSPVRRLAYAATG